MKLYYHDDKKENQHSHEFHGEENHALPDGNCYWEFAAYGSTPEESKNAARVKIETLIKSLNSAIKSLENSPVLASEPSEDCEQREF